MSRNKVLNANSAVIIDNQVLTKVLDSGLSVIPIRYLINKKKVHPNFFTTLPRITLGSRREDNRLLTKLISFDDAGKNFNIIDTIYNCRLMYFSLKFKQKFHKWYWKSQEKKIQSKYSPENLAKLLEEAGDDIDEENFDKLLKKW